MDNYYFYLELNGEEYGGDRVFKVVSDITKKNGTIDLCLLDNENRKHEVNVSKSLIHRFPLFREKPLIGSYIVISYDFVEFDPSCEFIAHDDDKHLAIELHDIREATESQIRLFEAQIR